MNFFGEVFTLTLPQLNTTATEFSLVATQFLTLLLDHEDDQQRFERAFQK